MTNPIYPHDAPHNFHENNVFGLNQSEMDAPIYRIFKKEYLIKGLMSKKMCLVNPSCWDDPFENFLLSRTAIFENENVSLKNFQSRFYGQCWSFCKESDAMWRIYSHDKDGIKVKTTPRKLFQVLLDCEHEFAALRYFIGRVVYLDQADLVKYYSDPNVFKTLLFNSTGQGIVWSLLAKRTEFAHEKEVRLIFHSEAELSQDKVLFDFSPNTLFEEMVLDPRINDQTTVGLWKQEIQSHGYRNSIEKSELYSLPVTTIKLG